MSGLLTCFARLGICIVTSENGEIGGNILFKGKELKLYCVFYDLNKLSVDARVKMGICQIIHRLLS